MEKYESYESLERTNSIVGMDEYKTQILELFETYNKENVAKRIWDMDYTVWSEKPDEISNRLGWLRSPDAMKPIIHEIEKFVDKIRAEGFEHALLLGMGGSSLAPEVFQKTFGLKKGYLHLSIVDSTDPGTIQKRQNAVDISKTLFIVSTKSGGTVETISLMKYFYNLVSDQLGKDKVGKHFIAITDPGSGLESMAKSLEFRKIFLNDPDIGGRFSALSLFGMVPASLVGVDISAVLDYATQMAEACKIREANNNPGLWLGIIIGLLAKSNREKLTFILSPKLKYLGAWMEQLIAESTGKQGVGILPIDGEEVLSPEYYQDDRLFVLMQFDHDLNQNSNIQKLMDANLPLLNFNMNDLNEIGSEYFRWEFATIIASRLLKINPFDQPNVESAKVLARKMVADYQKNGELPKVEFQFEQQGVKVLSDVKLDTLPDCIAQFLAKGKTVEERTGKKPYLAVQAYLTPSNEIDEILHQLRMKILKQTKIATTVGYGPRFLHSTGQLHKGDAGNGLFIQITGKSDQDLAIPEQAGSPETNISFATLIMAQALGDRQALINESRPVLLIDVGSDFKKGLQTILTNI